MSRTRTPPFTVVVRPLLRFFALESSGAIVLLASALAAFVWANLSPDTYELAFGRHIAVSVASRTLAVDLRAVINDALMTLFFFVVGMEIKRELVAGELRSLGRAFLPAIAAVGGMAVPALIYLAFNANGPGRSGWGVPIATDIAFCIGVLTLLERRVPRALIVFVTALAIFDDIGGIVVIALFYGHSVSLVWLAAALAPAAIAVAAGSRGSGSAFVYAITGAALWYALHRSGIHATIAGVCIGLAVPAHGNGNASENASPVTRFTDALHPWVAFGVMPAFALANSGVSLSSLGASDVSSTIALGVAVGLVVGKAVGIFTFAAAAVRLGVAPIPGNAGWAKLLGVSAVAGIGFTVALFIAALAFDDARLLLQAKLGIVLGSITAALLGVAILRATPALPQEAREAD